MIIMQDRNMSGGAKGDNRWEHSCRQQTKQDRKRHSAHDTLTKIKQEERHD